VNVLVFSCFLLAAPAEKPLAIKTDRVVTATGGVVENGVILIKGGKIVAIAPRLALPIDAQVIDAQELVAYPGMVLARTSIGVDDGGSRGENPTVADSFWPFGRTYERVLANGFTALGLVSRRGGLLGGQGVVIRPLPRKKDDILLGKSAFACINFSSGSRGALTALLKQQDRGLGGLLASGRLPAVISTNDPTSILYLTEILAPYQNMRKSIVPRGDLINALAALSRARIPCVLEAENVVRSGTAFEQNAAAALAKAQVPLCLLPRGDGNAAIETFRFDVARLIGSGLSPEEALKAVTITPAQILGVDWRIGSLEEGKDADIVLLDGDLFDPQAHIESVFIAGEKVYTREVKP